jgi:zinc transport system substrate-binding protein
MYKTISILFATTIFTTPVFADQLRVVVDIPPVHGIVDGVLGSNASITTLIGSGIDPHNYTMKPSHAAALSSADLIVLIGETLTPSLAEKLPSLASNAKIVELAEVPNVHLIALEEHDKHDTHHDDVHDHDNDHDNDADHDDHAHKGNNEHDHADDHHDDHGDNHNDDKGHTGHDHSGIDPHMWLDVDNANVWAHAIAKSASEIAPVMTSDINSNLASFEQSLNDIKSEIQALVAKPYSVSHDAFGYLEESLGIDHPQAVTNGMGLRPSPSDMADLRAQIEKTTPACMIIDPNDHTALAYALAEEYSINTVEFSQLGEIVEGKNAYLSLMTVAIAAFKACFQ